MDLNLSTITRPVGRLVATAQNGLEVLRLGGLETESVPSPSHIVESVPMYKLRRYFPPDNRPGHQPVGPPVLMVHPMMMSADMWDVTRQDGAVGILQPKVGDPSDLLLQFLPSNASAPRGALVLTSGTVSGRDDSLYPRGVPIGEVTSVNSESAYRSVNVHPLANLHNLEPTQMPQCLGGARNRGLYRIVDRLFG